MAAFLSTPCHAKSLSYNERNLVQSLTQSGSANARRNVTLLPALARRPPVTAPSTPRSKDEPSSGLHATASLELVELLKRLSKKVGQQMVCLCCTDLYGVAIVLTCPHIRVFFSVSAATHCDRLRPKQNAYGLVVR